MNGDELTQCRMCQEEKKILVEKHVFGGQSTAKRSKGEETKIQRKPKEESKVPTEETKKPSFGAKVMTLGDYNYENSS